MPTETQLKTNIKTRPKPAKIDSPKNSKKLPFRVSGNYYMSWAIVAAISVAGLSAVVMREGGIDDAMRTASFNKINRQIAENKFSAGADDLPTASIPQGINASPDQQIQQPSLEINQAASELAKNSSLIESQIYYSVFLGQGGSKSAVLDLWYTIKSENSGLFSTHKAAYYYDNVDAVYNLVVGEFENLGLSLQFCAELKFNDIACKYDSKFANLQTTSID